jgi:import inner membrane translocase subunit TIM44
MEQVKKDMEADEKLKKDWQKVADTSEKMRQKSEVAGGRLDDFGQNVKSASSKTSEILSNMRKSMQEQTESLREKAAQASEQSESIKKAADFAKSAGEATSERSKAAFSGVRSAFSGVMDSTSQAFAYFGDEHKKGEKVKAWKAARDAAAAAEEAKAEATAKAAEAGDEEGAKAESSSQAPEPETAMVVSKAHSSSWDRFGGGLRDSPFLSSAFELGDRMFGESEIAASIREMKELDPTFFLEEFAEDMEYVITPHIIKSYLEGDQKALQTHLGEAAFLSVNAGIKERKRQKLELDTAILQGPSEIELKGAKLMEQGPPCFIWTFNMQQVNCLRDKDGEIIEGAVDDIRTVCYAMAVTRHPVLDDPEKKVAELEYPWQISELAILWNQPCF